jgi:hypothetical protein
MLGEIKVFDDPDDPTLHRWLMRCYKRLRHAGEHERMGRAFASLVGDEASIVREAVVHFFRAWPADPAVPEGVRAAATKHRALYAGLPDTLGRSPAGLEGELLGALGAQIKNAADPALDELRSFAVRPDMVGPSLAALATHDPMFLVRNAAEIAAANPYWLATFLAIVGRTEAGVRVLWMTPQCDIVARIARAEVVPAQTLDHAIRGSASGAAKDALLAIAADPRTIGEYHATELPPSASVRDLRARCLVPGGCDGGLLERLAVVDPGMVVRSLHRILRVTPGVLGPLLAWMDGRRVDMAVTARRIRDLGTISREMFVAVASCTARREHRVVMFEAWPEP